MSGNEGETKEIAEMGTQKGSALSFLKEFFRVCCITEKIVDGSESAGEARNMEKREQKGSGLGTVQGSKSFL